MSFLYTCSILFKCLSVVLQLASVGFIRVVLNSKPLHLLILAEHQIVKFGFEFVNPGLLVNAETIDILDITNLTTAFLQQTKYFIYVMHSDRGCVHFFWR